MTASTAPRRSWGFPQSLPLQPLAFIVLVVVAYHYTLISLARGLALQTPLAYVALAPVIALALAWVGSRRAPQELPAPLPLDFLLGRGLGVLLIALAFVVALLVPLSLRFWLNRIDLISLPLFVAGAISLLYGPRRLWALRFPIAFLLLAWPAPYLPLVGEALATFTDATIALVALVSQVIPIATAGPEGLFTLQHGGEEFILAVGSACAGVNSLVGFFVVGSAMLYVVRGTLVRKLAWLVLGLLAVWLLNIVRIEAIFVAGTLFGPEAALDVLHPVAGLIVFNIGILLMLLLVPRAGLSFAPLPTSRPGPAETPRRASRLRSVPTLIVLAGALAMAAVNSGYARYEPLAGSLGQPRVATFDQAEAAVPGWASVLAAEYDHAKPFYGDTSTWQRYRYESLGGGALTSSTPLYVDIITTDDPNALAAYGVEACYRFHGYFIESQNQVDLGSGVQGEVIDYTNTKIGRDWSAVWWEWPYDDGGTTRYERVVIFMADGPAARLDGMADAAGPARAARFNATDDFLATFASQIVNQQLAAGQPVAVNVD